MEDLDLELSSPLIDIDLKHPDIEIGLEGGTRGLQGEQGPQGIQGPQGEPGPAGESGQNGQNGEDGFSPTITSSKVGKVTTLTITDVNGTYTTEILDGENGQGTGDMKKSVYDTNNNGIVDNAEKVNNHTVETDVPQNAVFTDTTYTAGNNITISDNNVISASASAVYTAGDNISISNNNVISATDTTYTAGTGIDITDGVISNTQTSAIWGNITGTLSNQTDLNNALSSKADTSSIPTKTSDLNNDSGFITNSTQDLAYYYTESEINANFVHANDIARVARTGVYSDLSGTPTIPTKTSDLNNDSGFINNTVNNLTNYTTTSDMNTALNGKASTTDIANVKSAMDYKSTDYMGNIVVESIRCKNLFDLKNFTNHNVDTDFTIYEDSVAIRTLSSGTDKYIYKLISNLEIGETYTFTIGDWDDTSSEMSGQFALVDSQNNYYGNSPVTLYQSNSLTFIPTETDVMFRFGYLTNSCGAYDFLTLREIQLETGSTATSYTPNDTYSNKELATVATSGSYNDLSNKPSLSTVATSGSYTDLSNKPTIPTKTSNLTNDSGFITKSVNDLTNYTKKGTVLYNNTNGTTGQVNLSETSANFKYLEIFYKQHEYTPIYSSVKVYSPNGKQVDLTAIQSANGGAGIASAYVSINGTTITKQDYNIFWTNGGNQHTDKIYITRVIGYKDEE